MGDFHSVVLNSVVVSSYSYDHVHLLRSKNLVRLLHQNVILPRLLHEGAILARLLHEAVILTRLLYEGAIF